MGGKNMYEKHELIEFPSTIPMKFFMHKLGYVERHWHKSLEILMVLDGNIEITIDDTTYSLANEDIILINPNCIHEVRSESAVMIAVQIDTSRLIHFDQELTNILFDCNSTTNPSKEAFLGIRFIIAQMIQTISHHFQGSEYRINSLLYGLVSELVINFQIKNPDAVPKQTRQMQRLSRIMDYIENHYNTNFSLADLAEQEGLSVPYLSSFFKKNLGIHFNEYYTSVKLDHALEDLKKTNDSLEAIAAKNGFGETHAFIRSFKKKYGITPSAWRQQMADPNHSPDNNNNLNYLMIQPSNYLHLLQKYLPENLMMTSAAAHNHIQYTEIPPISFEHSERKLRHTFKTFISVGRAKDILQKQTQDMLRDVQKNIGYRYIKFHGLFADDMMVVHRSADGKLHFHYAMIDMALDFLLSIHLKPMIQFSFMPSAMASIPDKTIFYCAMNTSPPKSMTEWNRLIADFTSHLIDRYGTKEVTSWLFTVWNEPQSGKPMFGFGEDRLFFRFYKETYQTVKQIKPEIPFGSPSFLYMENLGSNATWIRSFIRYTKEQDCIPDFINVHYYSDIFPNGTKAGDYFGLNPSSMFPKRTDDFSLWIGSIRRIFSSMELKDLPIYMTEWNFTVSHRNLINDTCFKSCYILKNLLKNYDRLESFGYWSLTDLIEENALPEILFHGGLGMYTMNGIRKNVFYSFYFANMLKDTLVAADDGYFITKDEQNLQIITYNYVHYGNLFASGELFNVTETERYSPFDLSKELSLSFTFTDMPNGRYEIREYFVNRKYGSSFDLWCEIGGVSLDERDSELLRSRSVPGYHKEYYLAEKNTVSYHARLEALEIRFTEIRYLG